MILRTTNLDICLEHDDCIVKLSLMPTSPIIFKNLFEFIVIVKFVLPSYHSETHFPYQNLVIAQLGATPFIMFIFCLFFKIMVFQKAFDVALSTTKLSLCTAYNHLDVVFYI